MSFEENSALRTIRNYAFEKQRNLHAVPLPSGISELGAYAFSGTGLLTVTLPRSLAVLGEGVFAACPLLTEILVEEANGAYQDINGVVYSKDGASLRAYPTGRPTATYTVLDGVTEIGPAAFFGAGKLEYVTLPESLVNIRRYAFGQTENMERVDLPAAVELLDEYSFAACGAKQYSLPESLREIGAYAISQNSRLTSIHIPAGVRRVGTNAFEGCSGLTRMVIPEGLSVIDSYTFKDCSALRHMEFSGDSPLSRVSYGAFSGCTSLTHISLPDNVWELYAGAFAGCSALTSITLGTKISGISSTALKGCPVTDFTVAEANKYLAFRGGILYSKQRSSIVYVSDAIKEITIPATLRTVSLRNHRSVEVIRFEEGDTRTYLAGSAFEGCTNLKTVILPDSLLSIPANAFKDCVSLTDIRIPDGVTGIGGSAFAGCVSLTELVLPVGMGGRLESYTFKGCVGLTEMVIPEGVETISVGASEGCANLARVILPHSVTFIGQDAFAGCSALTDTELPAGLVYLDGREGIKGYAPDAFEGCFRLKTVTVHGDCAGILSPLSNLEILIVTEMPAHGISGYFGHSAASMPLTLKAVVLGEGVRVKVDSFQSVSGVTIYVSDTEADLRWDENFPGWSGGNAVAYGDKWKTVTFRDRDGGILSVSMVLNQQIIRQPYGKDYVEGDYRFVFAGYDTDGDGTVDAIPATSYVDISARAVYRKEFRCVRDGHTPGAEADCDRDQLCLICGDIVTHRLGHKYMAETIPPTCTEQGCTTHTCTRCGHAYTEVYTPPTCTEGGYTTYTCSLCGESHRDSLMDPVGHRSGEWIVDIPPAPGVMGSQHKECVVCGVTLDTKEMESLPPETAAEPVTEAPTQPPSEPATMPGAPLRVGGMLRRCGYGAPWPPAVGHPCRSVPCAAQGRGGLTEKTKKRHRRAILPRGDGQETGHGRRRLGAF